MTLKAAMNGLQSGHQEEENRSKVGMSAGRAVGTLEVVERRGIEEGRSVEDMMARERKSSRGRMVVCVSVVRLWGVGYRGLKVRWDAIAPPKKERL